MSPKHVSFATIEIFEFPITLGDHPCVSMGPPLTIEWAPQRISTFELETFEEYRPQRRHRRDLVIDPSTREDVLIRAGICFDDIISWKDKQLAGGEIIKAPKKKHSIMSKSLRSKDRKLSDLQRRHHDIAQRLQRLNETLFNLCVDPESCSRQTYRASVTRC